MVTSISNNNHSYLFTSDNLNPYHIAINIPLVITSQSAVKTQQMTQAINEKYRMIEKSPTIRHSLGLAAAIGFLSLFLNTPQPIVQLLFLNLQCSPINYEL
jgi:hypothetical protein